VSLLLGLAARVRGVLRRSSADQRAREEFEFHIEMETNRNRELGFPPEEARRRARVAFGGVEQHREALHDHRAPGLFEFLRDIRLVLRGLVRAPGFTAIAILSLGMGLGLGASAIAVANAYLIRSLPFPDAGRLFHVMYAPPGPVEPRGMSAFPWSSVTEVVEHVITTAGETLYLDAEDQTRVAPALRVSAGFIEGLGVRAHLGRVFTAEEYRPGGDPVALIGHALWQDRFGGDRQVIGKLLRVEVEDRPNELRTLRIVGVLPEGFWFGRDSQSRPDIITPLTTSATTYMIRLRGGVPVADAERRLTSTARDVATWIPPDWPGVRLESAHERYLSGIRPTLMAIVVAAGMVLGLAAGNLTVLVLLRAVRRRQELAVRVALGAGTRHLLRWFVTEAGLICGAALAVGILLADLTLRSLAPFIEAQIDRPSPGGTAAIALDGPVGLVMLGVTALILLGLTMVQLLAPWQGPLALALRSGGRSGTDGGPMRWVRSGLIVVEVAGSLALLAGAGLMIQSAIHLLRSDLGTRTEQIGRVRLVLRGNRYQNPAAYRQFYAAVEERLAPLAFAPPAFANWPPFFETPRQRLEVAAGESAGGALDTGVMTVSPGYFATLGIPVVAGRAFSRADEVAGDEVAIVSEALAHRIWPGQNAIGRRLRTVEPDAADWRPGLWRTVVGVVADVRQTYGDQDLRDLYLLYPHGVPDGRFAAFHLWTSRPLTTLGAEIRSAVGAIDPTAVVRGPSTPVEEDRQRASLSFMSALLTGFALFAGLLALLGIYGVAAYAVQQREREVAIRVAVGATPRAIVAMFLAGGGRLLTVGLGAGMLGALALGRVLRSQLLGVEPVDLPTLVLAVVLLGGAGLAANWWPARRVATHSPLATLNES